MLLQIGELRRKINHATAKRNELREKCRQLHRKREACKHQRQVARLPVAFNSSDIDGSGGGGSGQQAVMMQPSRESSSGMRGQWIKVPESSHNEQQSLFCLNYSTSLKCLHMYFETFTRSHNAFMALLCVRRARMFERIPSIFGF